MLFVSSKYLCAKKVSAILESNCLKSTNNLQAPRRSHVPLTFFGIYFVRDGSLEIPFYVILQGIQNFFDPSIPRILPGTLTQKYSQKLLKCLKSNPSEAHSQKPCNSIAYRFNKKLITAFYKKKRWNFEMTFSLTGFSVFLNRRCWEAAIFRIIFFFYRTFENNIHAK